MKLLKPRTFVIFAVAGLLGAALLNTSQNVQHAEERLEQLQHSAQREEEKIRMLKAEWEALNRPERLERLADEFLEMVPPSPDQMAGDHAYLPEAQPIAEVPVEIPEAAPAPVLQPVAYEGASEPDARPVPVPTAKPAYKPPRKPAGQKTLKEKDFGDLLNELGGAQ